VKEARDMQQICTRWDERSFYLGDLCVGCIDRIVDEGWENEPLPPPLPPGDKFDFTRTWRESQRKWNEEHAAAPWNAYLTTAPEDSTTLGSFATEEAAKSALEHAALKALYAQTDTNASRDYAISPVGSAINIKGDTHV
jgi:hypothetical protein